MSDSPSLSKIVRSTISAAARSRVSMRSFTLQHRYLTSPPHYGVSIGRLRCEEAAYIALGAQRRELGLRVAPKLADNSLDIFPVNLHTSHLVGFDVGLHEGFRERLDTLDMHPSSSPPESRRLLERIREASA